MEKGYSAGAKLLGWTFAAGGYKTRYLSATLKIKRQNVLIEFRTRYTGVDKERFALPDINVKFTFALKFNGRGMVTGLDKTAIMGEVSGGYRNVNYDLSGLTIGKIKSTISKASKKFL